MFKDVLVRVPRLALTGFAAERDQSTTLTDAKRYTIGRFVTTTRTTVAFACNSITGHRDDYIDFYKCDKYGEVSRIHCR